MHSQNVAEDRTMIQTKIEYNNMNMDGPTLLHELMNKLIPVQWLAF